MPDTNSLQTPAARGQALVSRIAEGGGDIFDLAESVCGSLVELGELSSQAEVLQTIVSLVRLSKLQTQMTACRYRAGAMTRLAQIALEPEPGELSRKACVDLLKLQGESDFEQALPETTPPPPPGEEKILAVLERLGAQSASETANEG